MRSLLTYVSLFALFNLMLVRSSFSAQKVKSAKSKLQVMFGQHIIPDGMAEWVAVLDDSMHLFRKCLLTYTWGRCHQSKTCRVPELKFDGRMLPLILEVCEDPYQIIIRFLPFKIPWWAKVDMKPVIINFRHHESDGVFTIHSRTTITASVMYVRSRFYRGRFYIDGMLRYDCTKPRNHWNDRKKRVAYNMKAPNQQYTSIFYKLKMRIEIKQLKSYSMFRQEWKCERCRDIVNESGSFDSGRLSCAADMRRHFKRLYFCVNADSDSCD